MTSLKYLERSDSKEIAQDSVTSQELQVGNHSESTPSKTMKQLASAIQSKVDESDSKPRKMIKTVMMGGSYYDSACRLMCSAVSLTAFCFFSFHLSTAYREEHDLLECFTLDGQDLPLSQDQVLLEDEAVNMSQMWLILFYVHIGTASYTIFQIIVATVAYQTKERKTCCDRCVAPITLLHLPIQLGAFAWCHVSRYTHSGRVCAGDYLSDEDFDAVLRFQREQTEPPAGLPADVSQSFLIEEGTFIQWWITGWWIVIGTSLCCLGCCWCCCIKRLKPNMGLGTSQRE